MTSRGRGIGMTRSIPSCILPRFDFRTHGARTRPSRMASDCWRRIRRTDGCSWPRATCCSNVGASRRPRHASTPILDLPNQEPDFLRRLFRAWSWMALAQMSAERDGEKARAYLQEIVGSGVTGGMLDDARRMLDTLP